MEGIGVSAQDAINQRRLDRAPKIADLKARIQSRNQANRDRVETLNDKFLVGGAAQNEALANLRKRQQFRAPTFKNSLALLTKLAPESAAAAYTAGLFSGFQDFADGQQVRINDASDALKLAREDRAEKQENDRFISGQEQAQLDREAGVDATELARINTESRIDSQNEFTLGQTAAENELTAARDKVASDERIAAAKLAADKANTRQQALINSRITAEELSLGHERQSDINTLELNKHEQLRVEDEGIREQRAQISAAMISVDEFVNVREGVFFNDRAETREAGEAALSKIVVLGANPSYSIDDIDASISQIRALMYKGAESQPSQTAGSVARTKAEYNKLIDEAYQTMIRARNRALQPAQPMSSLIQGQIDRLTSK